MHVARKNTVTREPHPRLGMLIEWKVSINILYHILTKHIKHIVQYIDSYRFQSVEKGHGLEDWIDLPNLFSVLR